MEWLWQLHLKQLRSRLPGKKPTQRSPVHGASQLNLSGFIHDVLSLGPKFAVEKKRPPEKLLSIVRQLAKLVPEEEASRVVSECVDVIARHAICKPVRSSDKGLSMHQRAGVHTAVLCSGARMLPPITQEELAREDHATSGTVTTGTKCIMDSHTIIDVNSPAAYKSGTITDTTPWGL
ncbi:hypothetical protein HPB51_023173 [Rhipicephalus microplus]|uniref:Uncharacterized protein n=1 Tax=Rhipicephalus microplus TaxID=6941 RepID=A0A9J6F7R4_RHIMP|nr:hypothetical protein HPB51_023173 [Rhipicephalus microplus]